MASYCQMSDKRTTRVRVSSSIDELPAEARAKLEAMLSDTGNGLTYQDMVDIMAKDGFELSRAAICRYARRYLRHIRRTQDMLDQTRVFLQYFGDNPTDDVSRQINALIQNGLMWRLVNGQEELDDMDIKDAVKLCIQADRASVYRYRYKDSQIQRVQVDEKETEAERLEWLRSALRDKPELLTAFEDALKGDGKNKGGEPVEDGS